jgi:hypothetical protein
MSKLPYLVAEINAALEVYVSGRTGQQYNRAAFILCDDCTELASKLFLIRNTPNWSDTKANGHFKSFREVTKEVRRIFRTRRSNDYSSLDSLLNRIESRRERRNSFFHSTSLLDLNFHAHDCVYAFCDLLDYGKLLFPNDWDISVAATGNMATCEALIRLDNKANSEQSVAAKVNNILSKWPCHSPNAKKKGCEIAHHAEDMHLRLAIRNGGNELRDKLRALL